MGKMAVSYSFSSPYEKRLSSLIFQSIGLQFRIDRGVNQIVGIIAQGRQTDTQYHIQSIFIGVTCRKEV